MPSPPWTCVLATPVFAGIRLNESRSTRHSPELGIVAETMWTVEGNRKPALSHQRLEGLCDRRGLQQADGRAHPEEDLSVRGRWRSPLQVLHEGRGNFVRQWKFQRR